MRVKIKAVNFYYFMVDFPLSVANICYFYNKIRLAQGQNNDSVCVCVRGALLSTMCFHTNKGGGLNFSACFKYYTQI